MCPFESGKCEKEEEKLQKIEYLENEKSFLGEIKNIFHSFWRAIISWKIKNRQNTADTNFKEVLSRNSLITFLLPKVFYVLHIGPKCEEECPENLELFVCGTNGVTYKNACYLNRASCFAWGRIQLAHSGVCGKYGNSAALSLVGKVHLVDTIFVTLQTGSSQYY